MREYCTVTEVENYMSIDIENSFTSQVKVWIQQMSEYIDKQTDRVFIADGSASERIYEIDLSRSVSIGGRLISPIELVIDECVSTSTAVITLTIDGNELDDDEFLIYPATVEELPKTRLRLKEGTGIVFTEGEQNIKVSAKWGYSVAVPGDIKFVAMVLVAGMINESWSSEGEMSSVTMGRYTMSFKDEKQLKDIDKAKEILKSYTKPSV